MKIHFVIGLRDSEIDEYISDFYQDTVESEGWFWSTYSPKELINSVTKRNEGDDYGLLVLLRGYNIEEYHEVIDLNECTYSHFFDKDVDL